MAIRGDVEAIHKNIPKHLYIPTQMTDCTYCIV